MDSYYLTVAVDQAAKEIEQEILQRAARGEVQRRHFCILVYDWEAYLEHPDVKGREEVEVLLTGALSSVLGEAIICIRTQGVRDDWKWNYANYAMRKAIVSLETGLDSDDVYLNHAHLLQKGMALYAGAVCLGRLVCAISGLASREDKHFAGKLLARAFEICNELARAAKQAGIDFVGRPPDEPLYDGDDYGLVPNYHSFLDDEGAEQATGQS